MNDHDDNWALVTPERAALQFDAALRQAIVEPHAWLDSLNVTPELRADGLAQLARLEAHVVSQRDGLLLRVADTERPH